MKEISASKKSASKVMYEAFKIILQNWGEMSSKILIEILGKNLNFDEWELEINKTTWNPRWITYLHFFSIDFVKAWFLLKRQWNRIVTSEGEKAMKKWAIELLSQANFLYKQREKNRDSLVEKKLENVSIGEIDENSNEKLYETNLKQIEDKAFESIRNHIIKKNPYEFQDIVWALLKSMWYHVPYIASRWKDWWIDLIAYQDPLWAKPPRIKIQVKHRPEYNISIDEVQRMSGLLNKDWDIWIIVTSWDFTSDAKLAARNSQFHIELINFSRFLELRKQYYSSMSDENKNYIPLHPIYFLWIDE